MWPNRPLLVALLAALVLASCTPERVFTPRLTSDPVELPTPTSGAPPSGGRSELSAEEGLALIRQAFVLLLDFHVEVVDPGALLRAAWDGFAAALPAGQPRPETPDFGGTDPVGDLARFRAAYLAAAGGVGGGREGQAALAHAAVRKMAQSLSDCNTSFSDPAQVQEQAARLQGEQRFGGVGVRIKRRTNEPIVVWELLDGGSAGKAGIKPGDAILRVDGRDTASLTLEQIANLIRGPEGTQVKLTVERADGKRTQDFSLKRVTIAEPAFQSKMLGGNVAYMRLYSFSPGALAEMLTAMRTFEAQNPKGWILDLRTNGGGELRVLASLLSKLLKDGPFGYEVDRQGRRSALGPDGTLLPKQRPLTVLVSDTTSGAAEIFAAVVQHYRAGTVIGTKTAGCVGVGNRYELNDGSVLSLAARKLLGPDARELNRTGMVPTDVVEVSRTELSAGKDPPLQRALTLLGGASR
jgi:carboxyl-terminal processing protease